MEVVYNGNAPAYCGKACMEENMWLGNSAGHSVAGLFETSTEGNLTFPQELGAIVTVELTGSLDTATRCMYADLAVEADAALLAAGVDVGLYMHVGYYIPTTFEACTFGGTAYLSCLPYLCKFWIRQSFATNVAHELGHNRETAFLCHAFPRPQHPPTAPSLRFVVVVLYLLRPSVDCHLVPCQ